MHSIMVSINQERSKDKGGVSKSKGKIPLGVAVFVKGKQTDRDVETMREE